MSRVIDVARVWYRRLALILEKFPGRNWRKSRKAYTGYNEFSKAHCQNRRIRSERMNEVKVNSIED